MHCLKTGVCLVPAAEGPRLPSTLVKGGGNGAHCPKLNYLLLWLAIGGGRPYSVNVELYGSLLTWD